MRLKLMVFFFFLSFVGCEKERVDKNLYKLSKVSVQSSEDTSWKDFRLTLEVVAQYKRTEKVVSLDVSQNSLSGTHILQPKKLHVIYMGFLGTDAPKVLPNSLDVGEKIKKFHLKAIPSGEDLTNAFETKSHKKPTDFIEDINTDFGDQYGSVIKEVATFYFKEEPTFLKDKDFRVVFSISTEDGRSFSDTTKVIRLNW